LMKEVKRFKKSKKGDTGDRRKIAEAFCRLFGHRQP